MTTVLFYSTFSKACAAPLQFIKQHNLKIDMVRLDNIRSRATVKRGKNFTITSVPTLIVEYESGGLKTIVGGAGIISYLREMVSLDRAEEELLEFKDVVPSKVEKEVPKKVVERGLYGDVEVGGDDEEELEIEFFEDDEEEVQQPVSSKLGGKSGFQTGGTAKKPSRMMSTKEKAKHMKEVMKNSNVPNMPQF